VTGEACTSNSPTSHDGEARFRRPHPDQHDRRAAKHEARIEARWELGRIGRFVKAITTEPQSTRAWAIGAWGEEKLAEALAGIDGLQVLHDRRVRGTRGNIDHIAIAPAGVFVVDAKAYQGLIEIRNRGWFFRPDWRLTVGRRDKSKLARNMAWQVDAVRPALEAAGIDPLPPITRSYPSRSRGGIAVTRLAA
jgi:Nuclease-related domain